MQESELPSGAHWYVVHTKPRQEARALENLQRQGFECFLPTLPVQRQHRSGVRVAHEPMFARYLFIRLSSTDQNWAPIRSTLGVSTLVRFGLHPAKVPEGLIEFLRVAPQADVARLYAAGDEVHIRGGALQGLSALYQGHDGEARAFVLIDLLGKPHTLSVALNELRRVA
jgi:transcriptional antiterminator RfaH